jgi:Uma2 family endonuclease
MLVSKELTMAEQVKIQMTMQEFIERYEEQPFEFFGGKIYPRLRETLSHFTTRQAIHDKLNRFPSHEFFGGSVFVILNADETVQQAFVPDVSCFKKERFSQYEATYPDGDTRPLELVPDFIVEIVSPSDMYSPMIEKIETYIDYGVRLLWIVDPQRKTVTVYEGSTTSQTLHVEDTVSGSSVLPEFKLSVNDIFG